MFQIFQRYGHSSENLDSRNITNKNKKRKCVFGQFFICCNNVAWKQILYYFNFKWCHIRKEHASA